MLSLAFLTDGDKEEKKTLKEAENGTLLRENSEKSYN